MPGSVASGTPCSFQRFELESTTLCQKKPKHSTPVRRYADEQISMQRPAPLGQFLSMEALVQSHVLWDGTPSRMGNSFQSFQRESTTKRR